MRTLATLSRHYAATSHNCIPHSRLDSAKPRAVSLPLDARRLRQPVGIDSGRLAFFFPPQSAPVGCVERFGPSAELSSPVSLARVDGNFFSAVA